jgi:NAD(P)-dependent dehydrogenase (short-subunit alcohol dehydrogenase family)
MRRRRSSWSGGGPSDCARVVAAALERHGGLDIVCANAGIYASGRIEGLTPEDIEQVIGVNVKGTIPAGRLGTVADIGNAALFFATDEAAYIAGQTLVVDGVGDRVRS